MLKDPEWEDRINLFFDTFLRLQSTQRTREYLRFEHGIDISYQLADLLLKKEVYCGTFNGVDDMCPAYISKEQHLTILGLRKKISRRTKHDRIYLFSGLLRCGECGNRMSSNCSRGYRKDGTVYETQSYKCTTKYARGACNNSINPREIIIETYLLENVDAKLDAFILASEIEQKKAKTTYVSERSEIKRKLNKLKDLYINDLIDLDTYRIDYESLTHRLEEIPDIADTKPANYARHKSVFCEGWQKVYYSLSQEGKRTFWRNTLESITVFPDKNFDFIFLP